MPHMLLIIEPLGQRAERGRVAGEAAYQRMVNFSAELQAAGLLLGVNSLGTAAKRLSKRDGGTQVWDGPFAETKELITGYTLIQVRSVEEAQAWAARFPSPFPGQVCEIEVRRLYEEADFAPGGDIALPA